MTFLNTHLPMLTAIAALGLTPDLYDIHIKVEVSPGGISALLVSIFNEHFEQNSAIFPRKEREII